MWMSTHETVCNHLPFLRHLASPSLQGPFSHIGSHFSFPSNDDQDPPPSLYLDTVQILHTWRMDQFFRNYPLLHSAQVPWDRSNLCVSTVQTSYCWVIYEDEAVNIELVSSLGLLQIKLLWTSCTSCVEMRFHFSGMEAWVYDFWSIFSFSHKKNCQTIFLSGYSIVHL